MLSDAIDLYCERSDASLWSEPLNALSNLAFFVAAWLLWRSLSGRERTGDLRALALIIALVGAGSLAFHTFATRWAMYFDVGFIGIFLLVYVHRFSQRVLGWGAPAAALAVVSFVALDYVLRHALAGLPLNGSEAYAAAFFVLLMMAAWVRWRRLPGEHDYALAAAVFVVSVSLRSLDLRLCPGWPPGTHFGWHLCNAYVLWRALRGLSASARGLQ